MNIEIAERIVKVKKACYVNVKYQKSKFRKRNTKIKMYKTII